MSTPAKATDATLSIAETFVRARLAASATPDYPGVIPETMAAAYAIQDEAIGLFPDVIVGWKVGGVPEALQARLGAHRVAGPIFSRNLWAGDAEGNPLPAIEGGFAAVEAEFIARIGDDVDPAKTEWSIDEAEAVVVDVLLGVELAGSSFPAINDLGSAVVASDFGNNGGLLLGSPLADWRAVMPTLPVRTIIDGRVIGEGGAWTLAGGPMESVRFLLEICARRGRPLQPGQLVSTGAVTGVHRIAIGSSFTCDFGPAGALSGVIVRAEP